MGDRPVIRLVDPKANCGKIEPPVLITRVEPKYPAEVRRQWMEGDVVLRGVISADGVVQDLTVDQSTAQELTRLAMDAIRTWRYKPALCDGVPIKVYSTFTVSFKLKR